MEGYFDSLLFIDIKGELHHCTKFVRTAQSKLETAVNDLLFELNALKPLSEKSAKFKEGINALLTLTPAVINDLSDCDEISDTYFEFIEFNTEHSDINAEIKHVEEVLTKDPFSLMNKLFSVLDDYQKGHFYEFGYGLGNLVIFLLG